MDIFAAVLKPLDEWQSANDLDVHEGHVVAHRADSSSSQIARIANHDVMDYCNRSTKYPHTRHSDRAEHTAPAKDTTSCSCPPLMRARL